ncbi:cytochrome oxidase assembly family protein [Orientia tsutsugamushi str. UT76]|nr:cytochrome oxidase assembly family protein [Orientia tsutsugamushi str. UT76]
MDKPHIQIMSIWLIVSTLLLLLMIVVGGITRLTNAGLSIVEWNQYQELYLLYLQKIGTMSLINIASPEFNLINNQITISEFKYIFFIEYIHRLLGR